MTTARRRSMLRAWLAAAAVCSSRRPSFADALPSAPRSHVARRLATGGLSSRGSTTHGRDGRRRPGVDLPMSKSSQISSSSWSEMTVPRLKSQLKDRGLPVSGVKAELIQRLEEYEALDDEQQQTDASRDGKRSIAFPPPKDETEVKVLEKEVRDTVRLLDGLKLGGGGGVSQPSSSAPSSSSSSPRLSRQKRQEKELMESLKDSLKKTQQQKSSRPTKNNNNAPQKTERSAHAAKLERYAEQLRLRPANDLKAELSSLRLSVKGRKPDLVNRLAEYHATRDEEGHGDEDDEGGEFDLPVLERSSSLELDGPVSFAGIPRLSAAAATALHRAFGDPSSPSAPKPTPIQSVAVPKLFYPPNPSALLHAPTGSGKSISFLLPITETLWREAEDESGGTDANDMENGMALVLLPTRELAAQVAGVATVLAPPGMVRLVPRPMDLAKCWKDTTDRGEEFEYYENNEEDDDTVNNDSGRKYQPRILVGSARAVSASLFGDKKMPGTPTPKPKGKELLRNTRWLVLDEVDRLLDVKKSRTDKRSRHEKPAAMLAAAVSRLTVGRVQVIAASATVGRPLRRELARVLGLHGSECPETLRGEDDAARLDRTLTEDDKHLGRAVKIPDTVRNYVLPVDGSTSGSLLTSAAFAANSILGWESTRRRVLLVLTRNCGIQVHNAMGALRHFGIRPPPRSLLDALEADGADRLVEAHRRVSGVEGVGGARRGGRRRGGGGGKTTPGDGGEGDDDDDGEGYLLVTHEDNVRGLHLDALDAVVVVGRPAGPDEYTHIAGRTGRAGRRGSVLNVVGFEQAAALAGWTRMLGVDFLPVDEGEVGGILDD